MESTLMNSLGLWITGGLMVFVIVVQSVFYFSLGKKEAKKLGVPEKTVKASIRAASLTAIGPTLSSVIVLLSLVVTVGAPMAWMRLNDIGAARTELSVAALAQSLLPETASAETTFAFISWGMALNNVGWMVVALLVTKRMGWAVGKMNEKFNPKMVKAVMAGASVGLFAYLLSNSLVGNASPQYVAAVTSGIAMILISKLFAKNQRLQELSLGLAMIIGMVVGSIVSGMVA